MSISTLVRYTVIPLLLGWGAFATILVTAPNGDDISWLRMLAAFCSWIAVSAAAFTAVFYTGRRRKPKPDQPSSLLSFSLPGRGTGPECDRCGQPTAKPFLYSMPNHYWRCDPCEQKVTDILFTAATNGTLTESMLRYTRPFPTNRATEK